jgi:hypothetical protein
MMNMMMMQLNNTVNGNAQPTDNDAIEVKFEVDDDVTVTFEVMFEVDDEV